MMDLITTNGFTVALAFAVLIAVFFIIGNVFDIETNSRLHEAPRWYRRFRSTKIGEILIAGILILIVIWIISANLYFEPHP
jgi:threonine/homoserine/homoserine lactone efflux protein